MLYFRALWGMSFGASVVIRSFEVVTKFLGELIEVIEAVKKRQVM